MENKAPKKQSVNIRSKKKLKWVIIIIVSIISICAFIFIAYQGLVKYYECHPLPDKIVMQQLKRADGEDIELFGKIISPSLNEQGNVQGYAEMVGYCE